MFYSPGALLSWKPHRGVLEAFAEGTPVIVRNLGALPELVEESQGGLVFDSQESLSAWLGRLATDDELRDSLGGNGLRARRTIWSESTHLESYFALIDDHRRTRRIRLDRPHPTRSAGRRVRPVSDAVRSVS
jgi:glycosyltransferase involved in cell wall biosynthesis